MNNLVSTDWLADHLGDRDLVILDASWHLPAAKRDAKAEFTTAHIPGAEYFDLDAVSDHATTLPHMMPKPESFAAGMRNLGINANSTVICYDSVGLFSAARCWWMFKAFGHDKVSVLDGGFKKWRAEHKAVEEGPALAVLPGNFSAKLNVGMVRSLSDVAKHQAQVVDARSPGRFRGEEAEPRPGVRPGHIPGAHNVHYAALLNENGTLKDEALLKSAFKNAGVSLNQPIVTSCGSGVTAAILSLALTELGVKDQALYDGSWAEWGASGEPVATGA